MESVETVLSEGRTGEKYQVLVGGIRMRTGQCPRGTLMASVKTFTVAYSQQKPE